MNIIKYISFATLLSTWAHEASKDGEITPAELANLVVQAISMSGLDLNIKLVDD